MGFYSLVVKHLFRSFAYGKNGASSKGWKLCFCSLLVKYHQFLWRHSSFPYDFPILIGSTTFNQGFFFLLEGLHVVVTNKVKFYPLKYTIPQNKQRLTLPNSELKDYLALELWSFAWSMWIFWRELWHNDESAYNHRIPGFPIIHGKTKTTNSTETNQTKLWFSWNLHRSGRFFAHVLCDEKGLLGMAYIDLCFLVDFFGTSWGENPPYLHRFHDEFTRQFTSQNWLVVNDG